MAGVAFFTVLLAMSMLAGSDSSSLSSVWQQELPNTDIPEAFDKLASSLLPSETQVMVSKIRAAAGRSTAYSMVQACSSAGIYCPEKDVVVPIAGLQPRVCILVFDYEYGILPCRSAAASISDAQLVQASAIFMRQNTLTVGNKVQLPDTSDDLNGLKFLPSSIVDALPRLDVSSLQQLSRFYGVKRGSEMEFEMKNTLAHCSFKSDHHEVRACQASGEGMLDFVIHTIGHNVAMYAAPAMAKQEVIIMDVTTLSSQGENTVFCHNMKFPSLLFSCHMTHTAKLMDVSVKLANGHIAHMPAVCHLDTSYWNPSHIAFQALHVQPGKSSVCHWFPQNSFSFVQSTHEGSD